MQFRPVVGKENYDLVMELSELPKQKIAFDVALSVVLKKIKSMKQVIVETKNCKTS